MGPAARVLPAYQGPTSPARTATECNDTWGCAPRWEMTSPAASAPSRPAVSNGAPRTIP
jgi:hypothetical protein